MDTTERVESAVPSLLPALHVYLAVSVARVEVMENTLDTLLADGVFVIMALLPSPNGVDIFKVVMEPSVRVLIQLMLGRGKPSATQLRES